jgi:hypothetical protein
MGLAKSPTQRGAKNANIKFHVSADYRYYVHTPQKYVSCELRRAASLLQSSVSLGLIFGVGLTLEKIVYRVCIICIQECIISYHM